MYLGAEDALEAMSNSKPQRKVAQRLRKNRLRERGRGGEFARIGARLGDTDRLEICATHSGAAGAGSPASREHRAGPPQIVEVFSVRSSAVRAVRTAGQECLNYPCLASLAICRHRRGGNRQ